MHQAQPRRFQTTRWSLVVAAGGTTSAQSKAALSDLCGLYWYPVYAFIRRSGKTAADAQDLTQGLFADLMKRKDLQSADPSRGRFRSWLLGCARHYLANQHDANTALKRGGQAPIATENPEGLYALEPTDGITAEQLYLRRWSMLLLAQVLSELRAEATSTERFDLLRPYLVDEAEESYAQLGPRLGLNENAVKQAVFSLRERFRERLRAEISGTVASVGEVDDEIRQLLAALG